MNPQSEIHNPKLIMIRSATPADVPLILSLIGELADYEKLRHEVVATEEDLQHHLFGQRPTAEVVLAFNGDEPAGYALFFPTFSTFVGKPGIWLEDLFVREHLRGRGIGKALFLHVAKLAHERGCGRMEWAALDWNTPAISFYKKLGAIAQDEWTTFRLTRESLEAMSS
jgi:GNAT superfamily N-acetyltransferase